MFLDTYSLPVGFSVLSATFNGSMTYTTMDPYGRLWLVPAVNGAAPISVGNSYTLEVESSIGNDTVTVEISTLPTDVDLWHVNDAALYTAVTDFICPQTVWMGQPVYSSRAIDTVVWDDEANEPRCNYLPVTLTDQNTVMALNPNHYPDSLRQGANNVGVYFADTVIDDLDGFVVKMDGDVCTQHCDIAVDHIKCEIVVRKDVDDTTYPSGYIFGDSAVLDVLFQGDTIIHYTLPISYDPPSPIVSFEDLVSKLITMVAFIIAGGCIVCQFAVCNCLVLCCLGCCVCITPYFRHLPLLLDRPVIEVIDDTAIKYMTGLSQPPRTADTPAPPPATYYDAPRLAHPTYTTLVSPRVFMPGAADPRLPGTDSTGSDESLDDIVSEPAMWYEEACYGRDFGHPQGLEPGPLVASDGGFGGDSSPDDDYPEACGGGGLAAPRRCLFTRAHEARSRGHHNSFPTLVTIGDIADRDGD